MTAVLDRRTALYRFYDANGALLYVGITYDPTVRFYHHATYKPWWPQVTRREVAWYDTRDEAGAAEAKAIIEESPLWNIATPDENGRYQAGGGRPRWQPKTEEQQQLLDRLGATAASLQRARAEFRALADQLGVGRATIYRRLGRDAR